MTMSDTSSIILSNFLLADSGLLSQAEASALQDVEQLQDLDITLAGIRTALAHEGVGSDFLRSLDRAGARLRSLMRGHAIRAGQVEPLRQAMGDIALILSRVDGGKRERAVANVRRTAAKIFGDRSTLVEQLRRTLGPRYDPIHVLKTLEERDGDLISLLRQGNYFAEGRSIPEALYQFALRKTEKEKISKAISLLIFGATEESLPTRLFLHYLGLLARTESDLFEKKHIEVLWAKAEALRALRVDGNAGVEQLLRRLDGFLKFFVRHSDAREIPAGVRAHYDEGVSSGGGQAVFSCFTGDTYLKLESGRVISFKELAGRLQGGEPLPKVASYDERTGQVVYQQPTRFDTHTHTRTAIYYITVEGSAGKSRTLSVTGEHPMLVERGRRREWVKVKDLCKEDRLVSETGRGYSLLNTYPLEMSQTVYNLSFSGERRGSHPTFLVCLDPAGKECVVAHNKI